MLLAQRYERFHGEIFSSLEEPLPLPMGILSMPELELQSLWYAGEFGSRFISTDGRPVEIKDWGAWNSSAGPDFLGCAVQVGEALLRGDVELDPDARDWERHGHGGNPAYNAVVLHLVVRQPEGERFYTRTSEHREVAQVLLTDAMLQSGRTRPSRLAAARLGRCSTPLAQMEASAVRSLLESAAQFRLKRKSTRLHQWAAAHGRDQAIYQALAQTLGYKSNAQPFLMLVQRLQLKQVLALSGAEREALLFGVSGFLESVAFDEARADTRGYLRSLWEDWWRMRAAHARWAEPAHRLPWRLAGSRPGNHPQRRLAALCAMLRSWRQVADPLRDAARWSAKAWRSTLEELSDTYWDTHYTLLAAPAAKPIAMLGDTRIQEMLANVVYPLLVPERGSLWAEYLELPALLENEKVKRAALRLFGQLPDARHYQKKLHHQQGLLQLYEDFCLEDASDCADCPFPERLREWK
jgi:hypothetical protein